MNYIKLMTAFDVNGNGIVESREFVELVENAMSGLKSSGGGLSAPSNANAKGGRASPSNSRGRASPSNGKGAPRSFGV